VAGGFNSSGALPSGEIYDPVNNSWATVSNSMSNARCYHSASRVGSGATGVAVLAGGTDFTTNPATPLATVDKYVPPPTNAFGSVASMTGGRYAHTGTAIDSDRVLVTGGFFSVTNACTRTSQIYDLSANSWSNGGTNASISTCYQTATALSSTKVLVAGGRATLAGSADNDVALFTSNGSGGTWNAEPDMASERRGHAATLVVISSVPSVVVSGGINAAGTIVNTAEVYTP
jgi:hypothetical protein